MPSLATAAATPSLLSLAASLLGGCREPEPLDAAMNLLASTAAAARLLAPAGATAAPRFAFGGDEAEAAALRARLQGALCGCGEAIVRGAIVGLADSLPEPSWPCVADVLAPMLHLDGWARPDALRAWAHAALAVLPATDGQPDARCREALLTLLCAFPDPCAAGAPYHRLVGQLGSALADFARVARRLAPAHSFDPSTALSHASTQRPAVAASPNFEAVY